MLKKHNYQKLIQKSSPYPNLKVKIAAFYNIYALPHARETVSTFYWLKSFIKTYLMQKRCVFRQFLI